MLEPDRLDLNTGQPAELQQGSELFLIREPEEGRANRDVVRRLSSRLGNRVKELAAAGLASAGILVDGGSTGASLDLQNMPAAVREIMRAAYGDATAEIFLISAVIGIVALVAILFIKEQPLRRTVDIQPEATKPSVR